jgi:hypothetical protein
MKSAGAEARRRAHAAPGGGAPRGFSIGDDHHLRRAACDSTSGRGLEDETRRTKAECETRRDVGSGDGAGAEGGVDGRVDGAGGGTDGADGAAAGVAAKLLGVDVRGAAGGAMNPEGRAEDEGVVWLQGELLVDVPCCDEGEEGQPVSMSSSMACCRAARCMRCETAAL